MNTFFRTLFTLVVTLSSFLFSQEKHLSPDIALARLIEGNVRYVKHKMIHPNNGFEARMATAESQNPFAIILGCSDSRVSPEIIFDQGIGDLFIIRIAGNILGGSEYDSMKYAVSYLDSSVVLVLGHESCGAIKAAIDGKAAELESIGQLILPAVEKAKKQKGDLLRNAIRANVEMIVNQLRNIPYMQQAIKNRQIQIKGGIYDLETGKVSILEI